MVDFRTILKVEDHSRSQRSLKDIFTGLVEEPKQYPCRKNRRHYFLVFESVSAAEHAFSHKRNFEDVSVLLADVHLDRSSRTTEEHPEHGIAAKIGADPTGTFNPSSYITPSGSFCRELESPKSQNDRIYAHSSSCDAQNDLPSYGRRVRTFPDNVALSVQDTATIGIPLRHHSLDTSLARGSRSGPGISLLPNGPTVATPLTCDSRIYLSLCGEIIAYDLNSEPSNPQVVIELLRATKSERGNYMIAGAFYRRMGHPQSAKAVLLSMLEEFSGTIDSEFLRPAYLLLSGCELDIARVNKAANTDASVQYAAAQTWLQKVFGKSRSRDVSSGQKENRQELGAARSAADNRMCTCGGEYKNPKFRGQINIMEREIQCLRDRNTNQQKQLSNLRSLKRKLEDDVFYERDMRRKYQRQLEDLERIYPREREAHVLELASGHVDRA
uniref:Uncharacterized protein n=1 Tax=Psilocybe cubensis TaxID=181762 RepID=A0A8H7Y422_PSICU